MWFRDACLSVGKPAELGRMSSSISWIKNQSLEKIKFKDQNFVIGITEPSRGFHGRIWKRMKQPSSTINNTISLEKKERDLLRKSTHKLNTKIQSWKKRSIEKERETLY